MSLSIGALAVRLLIEAVEDHGGTAAKGFLWLILKDLSSVYVYLSDKKMLEKRPFSIKLDWFSTKL